tara:strand:+ start:764 stop:1516 length:753 start_codon:yes stop_codon:yes gene_type:complete
MLSFRVIPTILWEGSSAVKGENFNSWRKLGPIGPAINIYTARNVDEIIILNLAPEKRNTAIDFSSLARFFAKCNLPLTYGGGIKNFDQITNLLQCGVDKISLGTICFDNPNFVKEISAAYGKQFIIGSIDYKYIDGEAICFSNCGQKCQDVSLLEHAQTLANLGVGELLLNCIDKEGLMQGLDLSILEQLRPRVKVPIILSGGAASVNNFIDAFKAGSDGVAASSCFLFSEVTPKIIKDALESAGYKVRN